MKKVTNFLDLENMYFYASSYLRIKNEQPVLSLTTKELEDNKDIIQNWKGIIFIPDLYSFDYEKNQEILDILQNYTIFTLVPSLIDIEYNALDHSIYLELFDGKTYLPYVLAENLSYPTTYNIDLLLHSLRFRFAQANLKDIITEIQNSKVDENLQIKFNGIPLKDIDDIPYFVYETYKANEKLIVEIPRNVVNKVNFLKSNGYKVIPNIDYLINMITLEGYFDQHPVPRNIQDKTIYVFTRNEI